MKRTAKAGQRRTLPDMQEIDALFKGQKQNAVVYFLDETFEELQYDASTTVAEAVEQLAAHIKLENYQTFSLFAVQKVGEAPCRPWPPPLQEAAGSPLLRALDAPDQLGLAAVRAAARFRGAHALLAVCAGQGHRAGRARGG